MSIDLARFEGHTPRECGEHRTTGSRAWCFDCHEWCYPNIELACKGCELPQLRKRLVELQSHLLPVPEQPDELVITITVHGPEDARGMVANDVDAWIDVSLDEWHDTGATVRVAYSPPPVS